MSRDMRSVPSSGIAREWEADGADRPVRQPKGGGKNGGDVSRHLTTPVGGKIAVRPRRRQTTLRRWFLQVEKCTPANKHCCVYTVVLQFLD